MMFGMPFRDGHADHQPETAEDITAGYVTEIMDAEKNPAEPDQRDGDGAPEHTSKRPRGLCSTVRQIE